MNMNLFYLLADVEQINICSGLNMVWTIFGYIILGIEVVVPILLIVSGMITMAQAVMKQKEEDIKKAQSLLVKKVIAAVITFLIIALTKMIVNLVTKDENWASCAKCVFDVNGAGCGIISSGISGCSLPHKGQNFTFTSISV